MSQQGNDGVRVAANGTVEGVRALVETLQNRLHVVEERERRREESEESSSSHTRRGSRGGGASSSSSESMHPYDVRAHLRRQHQQKRRNERNDVVGDVGDANRQVQRVRDQDDVQNTYVHAYTPKVEIPEFDGNGQPDDFLDWLHTVERIFEYQDVPGNKKVKLVAIKLRKHASLWWESLLKKRERRGKDKIRTWDKMVRELKKKFLPEDYKQDVFIKLQNLKQGAMSVSDYTADFDSLMIKANINEPEEQTIARYLAGLRVDIANGTTSKSPFAPKPKVDEKDKSKKGGDDAEKAKLRQERKCFKCHCFGHMAADCPNRRVVTLVEDNDDDNEEVTQVVEGEDWKRKNVFHTRCTCQGKVCMVIIDSGSFENLASVEMVEKLGLKTTPHPSPYKLSWLKDESDLRVTLRCVVPFSIGKHYSDEITLAPLKPNIVPTPKKEALLMTRKEVIRELRGEPIAFALVDENDVVQDSGLHPKLLPLFDEYGNVFPDEIPAGLPPLRDIQHQIDLIPGSVLPNKPTYRMSPKEYEELQRQVEELLQKGLIRESLSPCPVPALLVPKKDGSWRMCIDSRAINKITFDYRFPIPRLDDLLDQLHGAKVFSKIDLRSGYHQIRMKPLDEWKTTFKTRDSLYEWLVMPFGLSNAPNTFMRFMNHVPKSCVGECVVVYFDDILVYSPDEDSHIVDLRKVFDLLRNEKLYANVKKCHFFTHEVAFFGVYCFGRFIKGFSTIVAPITECLKSKKFCWTREAQASFDELKRRVTEAPTLKLLDFSAPFEVECDVSDDFYALVRALDHWSQYLLPQPFVLFSDHEALNFINQQHKLNRRHAKWVELLQSFSFSIKHKVGAQNVVADALSRKFTLLTSLQLQVVGFEAIRELYEHDEDFGDAWRSCHHGPSKLYSLVDDYLFYANRLCVPRCSLRLAIVEEAHGGTLSGHLGRAKTLYMVQQNYYWSRLERDVARHVLSCHDDNKEKNLRPILKRHSTLKSMEDDNNKPKPSNKKVSFDLDEDGFKKLIKKADHLPRPGSPSREGPDLIVGISTTSKELQVLPAVLDNGREALGGDVGEGHELFRSVRVLVEESLDSDKLHGYCFLNFQLLVIGGSKGWDLMRPRLIMEGMKRQGLIMDLKMAMESLIESLRPTNEEEDSVSFIDSYKSRSIEEHNGANVEHVSDKHGDVMDVQEDAMVDPGLNTSLEELRVGGIAHDRPLLGEAAQHQPLDRPSHAPSHGATGHNRPLHRASTGHNRPSHAASAHNRPMDPLAIPQGPMIRARAKRIVSRIIYVSRPYGFRIGREVTNPIGDKWYKIGSSGTMEGEQDQVNLATMLQTLMQRLDTKDTKFGALVDDVQQVKDGQNQQAQPPQQRANVAHNHERVQHQPRQVVPRMDL
ncbi:reverse transcriptase [Corchorus capsularis]|uniref:RNA-directed DNA polymerase n=1 Tax=Corchorus capsularis TaxID=210143 RepID=A0A1R3JYV3_COCAP|nr:reverse transcriptase [Corchorus capsularis]